MPINISKLADTSADTITTTIASTPVSGNLLKN